MSQFFLVRVLFKMKTTVPSDSTYGAKFRVRVSFLQFKITVKYSEQEFGGTPEI